MNKLTKATIGTAISASSFTAGQMTATTEIFVKAPLGYQHEREYVQDVCKELDERTWLISCRGDYQEQVE